MAIEIRVKEVTDDNPRNEDPAKIRAQIISTCPKAVEIADRAEAIRYGIKFLVSGDALIIAGKGHEGVQIFGDQSVPFVDADQARISVKLLSGSS